MSNSNMLNIRLVSRLLEELTSQKILMHVPIITARGYIYVWQLELHQNNTSVMVVQYYKEVTAKVWRNGIVFDSDDAILIFCKTTFLPHNFVSIWNLDMSWNVENIHNCWKYYIGANSLAWTAIIAFSVYGRERILIIKTLSQRVSWS